MNTWIAVFLGGGMGSLARYFVTHYSLRFIESEFPWGTFISNILACLILALSIVLFREKFQIYPLWKFFIVTGFCGGFSTFSTFSFENYVLFRNDHIFLALLNIFVSVVFGIVIMLALFKDFRFES